VRTTPSSALCWPQADSLLALTSCRAVARGKLTGADCHNLCPLWAAARQLVLTSCLAVACRAPASFDQLFGGGVPGPCDSYFGILGTSPCHLMCDTPRRSDRFPGGSARGARLSSLARTKSNSAPRAAPSDGWLCQSKGKDARPLG
jgi:hypothetical protein